MIGRHEGRHRSLTQHHANKDSKEEMGREEGGGDEGEQVTVNAFN